MNWAKDIGDEVLLWVQAQLKQKQHEQQAYRVCLGLLSLSRNYPANRGGVVGQNRVQFNTLLSVMTLRLM